MIVVRNFLTTSLLLIGFLLISISPTYAQLEIPNIESSVFISTVPQYPKPGDTVQIYAQSVFYDLPQTNNTWTVNGKVVAQGIGVTEGSFVAGALGSRNVIVFQANSDTSNASARKTIIPTEIDLLYESDSLVPPFYRGRALPSEGSSVRVLAMPRFLNSSGNPVSQNSLIYTWKRNGSVVASASGRGRGVAVFPSPVLFGADVISVDVTTTDGTMTGSATINISSTKPLLLLYEDHPLFGVMYHKALGPTTFVPESEATFVAVPYYISATNSSDNTLIYDWTVNGLRIPADTVKKSAITISSAGQKTGIAQVQLNLAQPQNPFFSAHGEWKISFSEIRGGKDPNVPINNPFLPRQQ